MYLLLSPPGVRVQGEIGSQGKPGRFLLQTVLDTAKKIKTDQMKKKIWDHLFQTRKKSNFLFKSSNIVNF